MASFRADARDAGAAAVHAGARHRASARATASTGRFMREGSAHGRGSGAGTIWARGQRVERRRSPTSCSARLREESPAFFRQLRADVCALYLSDPAVWQRIGFPGPSTESGGYPDFDQPQTQHASRP